MLEDLTGTNQMLWEIFTAIISFVLISTLAVLHELSKAYGCFMESVKKGFIMRIEEKLTILASFFLTFSISLIVNPIVSNFPVSYFKSLSVEDAIRLLVNYSNQ